tara:strand:+ start:782 stop:1558 length:777 start_codon:yes stop_codon:yes gene_type:complete
MKRVPILIFFILSVLNLFSQNSKRELIDIIKSQLIRIDTLDSNLSNLTGFNLLTDSMSKLNREKEHLEQKSSTLQNENSNLRSEKNKLESDVEQLTKNIKSHSYLVWGYPMGKVMTVKYISEYNKQERLDSKLIDEPLSGQKWYFFEHQSSFHFEYEISGSYEQRVKSLEFITEDLLKIELQNSSYQPNESGDMLDGFYTLKKMDDKNYELIIELNEEQMVESVTFLLKKQGSNLLFRCPTLKGFSEPNYNIYGYVRK